MKWRRWGCGRGARIGGVDVEGDGDGLGLGRATRTWWLRRVGGAGDDGAGDA